eukprot:1861291-Pyramimonas_sp.AAC.1
MLFVAGFLGGRFWLVRWVGGWVQKTEFLARTVQFLRAPSGRIPEDPSGFPKILREPLENAFGSYGFLVRADDSWGS